MKPLEEMGKFATVVIDPPWQVAETIPMSEALLAQTWNKEGLSRPMPYNMMSIKEISELPLPDVLADSALVFCWSIRKYLPDTFDILKAWGLRYRFTMVWHKPNGPQIPNGPKFNGEFIVAGATGNPKFQDIKAFNVVNHWPSGAHSEKPEGFYDLLRRVTPGPRLDIFGRRRIAGFTSWGNEAPEGEPEPDHYQLVL